MALIVRPLAGLRGVAAKVAGIGPLAAAIGAGATGSVRVVRALWVSARSAR
jgi:ABC-type proline/glycine betaine transport system permease subunit